MAGDVQYADSSALLKEQSYRLIRSRNKTVRFIRCLLWAAAEMVMRGRLRGGESQFIDLRGLSMRYKNNSVVFSRLKS